MGKRNRTIRAERAEKQRKDFEGSPGGCVQCGADLNRETWGAQEKCDDCAYLADPQWNGVHNVGGAS